MRYSGVRRKGGFTLVEVVVSVGMVVLLGGGILTGYIQSARFADWQAHSLAAQSLAMQRLEQTRAAKWDRRAYPAIDQLVSSNFPAAATALDLPVAANHPSYATNFTTITDVTVNPPLRMIQVACVWRFGNGRLFTNSIATYRAPDQ
jgi:type II secretory pathway pseudopilin PulG